MAARPVHGALMRVWQPPRWQASGGRTGSSDTQSPELSGTCDKQHRQDISTRDASWCCGVFLSGCIVPGCMALGPPKYIQLTLLFKLAREYCVMSN